MILVDTNVLFDVLEDDSGWATWSQGQLDAASATDTLAINTVSELSIAFARIEELEALITDASLAVEPIPREALFLAGKVFLNYRRARVPQQGVLPDFYIGAHAAVMQWPITADNRNGTREAAHHRTARLGDCG
jgi:predicted nucleic acid-binding protein